MTEAEKILASIAQFRRAADECIGIINTMILDEFDANPDADWETSRETALSMCRDAIIRAWKHHEDRAERQLRAI